MQRILIFGNSGSGKSTLAKALCREHGLAHLDLDTLAWQPVSPPQRRPLDQSWAEMERFIAGNGGWVIEGCYADLLELALPYAGDAIFMDLTVEACIANARARPWEPHKYASKVEQDANLEMLVDWIAQYPTRSDSFSRSAHQALFEAFAGRKRVIQDMGDVALIGDLI